MIRAFKQNDSIAVMQIWLNTNIKAHHFVSSKYWIDNYDMVKDILPHAEIYVHENDTAKQLDGFIGISGDYIEGIFVKEEVQSKGIGKQLLDFVKLFKTNLRLSVYQKNTRAISFYQKEQSSIQSENIDTRTSEREFIMTWNK